MEAGKVWLFTKFISKSKLQVSNILFKSTVLTVWFFSILYDFKKFTIFLIKASSLLIFGLNLLISIKNCSLNNPRNIKKKFIIKN